MPLESGEVLSRSLQQIIKACGDAQSAIKELGTGRDALAREKLRRIRLLVQQCESRVNLLVTESDASLQELRRRYEQRKSEYDVLMAEATRRERQTFRQFDPADVHDDNLDILESRVAFREAHPIDLSEFHTEEAIQREKLQNAREIESDVMDLKTTYQEFHSLVHQQQEGLDRVTNNVTESRSLIEHGHEQIQGASRRQKSFRTIGCIGGAVLVVVVVVVIIVVVTASSNTMDLNSFTASAPPMGSPSSPFDNAGSPFREQVSSQPSANSFPGVNSSPGQSSVHVDVASHALSPLSMHSGTGMPPSPQRPSTAAVKAPWDEAHDGDAAEMAPRGAPFPTTAATHNPGAPQTGAPPPAVSSQNSISSPAEPHPTPNLAAHAAHDGFMTSSPYEGSPAGLPKQPPTSPEKPSTANAAKMEALNKQVASRTAAMDAASKEKESKIIASAQEYLKVLKAKREKDVMAAKLSHKQEQQAGTTKIDTYRKSGAVWNAVGMMVDLQKPNAYSKGTEQMRSLLNTLNATPAKN